MAAIIIMTAINMSYFFINRGETSNMMFVCFLREKAGSRDHLLTTSLEKQLITAHSNAISHSVKRDSHDKGVSGPPAGCVV